MADEAVQPESFSNPFALRDAADTEAALFDNQHPRHRAAVDALENKLMGEQPADGAEALERQANAHGDYEFGNITVAGGHDPEFDAQVGRWAAEAELPPWLANHIYQAGAGITEVPSPEQIEQQGVATEQTLRAQWGADYDERIEAVQTLVFALPDEAIALLDATGLGNDERVIRALDNYLRMSK